MDKQYVILPKKENGELLQKYEILIYVCIRRYMNAKTMKAFPSLDTIAKDSGCSKPTILKILKEIERKGYIKTELKGGVGNVYTFNSVAALGLIPLLVSMFLCVILSFVFYLSLTIFFLNANIVSIHEAGIPSLDNENEFFFLVKFYDENRYVPVDETVKAFGELISGSLDHIPEQCFFMKGGLDDIISAYKETNP